MLLHTYVTFEWITHSNYFSHKKHFYISWCSNEGFASICSSVTTELINKSDPSLFHKQISFSCCMFIELIDLPAMTDSDKQLMWLITRYQSWKAYIIRKTKIRFSLRLSPRKIGFFFLKTRNWVFSIERYTEVSSRKISSLSRNTQILMGFSRRFSLKICIVQKFERIFLRFSSRISSISFKITLEIIRSKE